MNKRISALCCLLASLSGCASAGRTPPTVPARSSITSNQAILGRPVNAEPQDQGSQSSPEERPGMLERAGRLTGRVRDRVACVPATIQNVADTVGSSDAMVCLLPVLVVAGFVVALVGGSGPVFSGVNCGTASP